MKDERIENLAGLYKAARARSAALPAAAALRRHRGTIGRGPAAGDIRPGAAPVGRPGRGARRGRGSSGSPGTSRSPPPGGRRPMQPLDALAISAGRETAADEDPRLDAILSAISGLPDILREALELRLREGLSYEEMAQCVRVRAMAACCSSSAEAARRGAVDRARRQARARRDARPGGRARGPRGDRARRRGRPARVRRRAHRRRLPLRDPRLPRAADRRHARAGERRPRRRGSSTMPSSPTLPLTDGLAALIAALARELVRDGRPAPACYTRAVVHHLPLAAPSVRRADVHRRAVERLALAARPHADDRRRARARRRRCPPRSAPGSPRARELFRVGITPYYASLMDPVHASCPMRMQAIPRALEADIRDEELRDPLGEDTHNPAPSVVHKYPDRVLFLVVDRCGIYCRHCNRRRLVGGDEPPTTADLEAGLEYIAKTPRIRDVLLSGGDPLLLSTRRLDYLLGRLRAIPHVETIRIGTRVPVVCPMRIDDELTRDAAQAPPAVHQHALQSRQGADARGARRLRAARRRRHPRRQPDGAAARRELVGALAARADARPAALAREAVLPVPGRHRDRHRSPAHARRDRAWSCTAACAAG